MLCHRHILSNNTKAFTFKNERGVPVLCNDGLLKATARGDRDTTAIYAYNSDNQIVGKVNILSYDKQTRKICLVPIGNAKAPDATKIKSQLDEIFKNLMIDFEVSVANKIDIDYKNGSQFTHGGSGIIGVYNADQKSAINKLKSAQTFDNETVYFFLTECSISNQLDENDKIQVVNGYMPRGYQFGFIYNEYTNARTIAHELCHGAFHLKHTFDATDYLASEGSTDNLMDYNGGTTLNHWQWKDIHQPKSVRFKWLQEESGAESANITNAQEVIDDVIEKIRCAQASGRNKIFVGSYSSAISAFSKTLNFNIKCDFGDKYKKYQTYTLTFPYEKTSYNNYFYKYNFGDIYFLISKEVKVSDFERYINNDSFGSQKSDIQTAIKQGDITSALKNLYRSSYCVFEQLTNNERKQLIKGLSEQWTLPESDENMVLNLLRASADDAQDAKDILSYIFASNSKIFKSLQSGIDNFNGYASYSEYMKLLVDLYVKAYKEDLEYGYIQNQHFAPITYVDYWQKDDVGSNIQLINGTYKWTCVQRRYDRQYDSWTYENGTYNLGPLQMINIVFKRDVSGFKDGDVVAMPMFYYAYLMNENLSAYKANALDNLLFCISVLKAVGVASKGIKAVLTVGGALTVGDAVLGFMDKVIDANEDELRVRFDNNKLNYDHFSDVWKNFYSKYQATSSLNDIVSHLKGGNSVKLLYDGLGVVNMYLSESSKFTKEQIKSCNELLEQIKTIINDDVIH